MKLQRTYLEELKACFGPLSLVSTLRVEDIAKEIIRLNSIHQWYATMLNDERELWVSLWPKNRTQAQTKALSERLEAHLGEIQGRYIAFYARQTNGETKARKA
jgi:superoxide dismutase